MKIDLSGVYKALNKAFWFLLTDQHRNQVLIGGAGSGKSYDVAIKIIYKCLLEQGHRFLVVRKVGRTLKHSVFDQLKAIISSWGMIDLFRFNLTDLTITCLVNNNEILFTGLDDVEKLKSVYGVTDIWVEEASELLEADFNQLDLRLRGETKYKKQIIMTMNPISAQHWVKKRFFDRVEADTITHRSTYKDNRFLDKDSIARLENIEDPYFKAVYVNGEWGVYGNIVFHNYIIEDFEYGEDDLENVCQGQDYGFVHASAIVRCGFKDDDLYVFDELYGKNWTNADFMQATSDQWGDIAKSWYITSDSAEPDRIEEWGRAGYKITPAKKGKGSLKYGVDFLSSKRIHIHTRCVNTAREIQSYQRREDKDGNVMDDFIELNDDCIAALRYATEWIWGQYHGRLSEYGAEVLGL
ncbi:MAG: PBSX family phage terminase large subunit [Nitrososphaerota archaeon]